MAKSTPSVLWYSADYLVGVIGMTWEEQGRYCYLLNLQQQRGHLDIKSLMPDCPPIVLDKFLQDEDGLYYNKRMEEEMQKRYRFVESRRSNLSKKKETTPHMGKHTDDRMDNDKYIYINNNSNSNSTPLPPSSSQDAEPKDVVTIHGETIREVVNHLNEVVGSKFRPNTAMTVRKIVARLNEGYTLEDFIKVIDIKAEDWKGTEYQKFLRPETLFGSKFESYVNQTPAPEKEEHRKGLRNRVFNHLYHGKAWADLDPEEQSVTTEEYYNLLRMQDLDYLLMNREGIIGRFE